MKLPTDRTIFQNAWVVADLEAAVEQWVNLMKVGPFFMMDHSDTLVDISHRGEPGELKMKAALGQAGPVQIELIEVKSEGPNCYRDLYGPGESGFHHMCAWTHDIEADIAYFERQDCDVATQGRVRDSVRFAYFDTFHLIGSMMEVVEYSEQTAAVFDLVRQASVDWDGKDPMRTFGS